MKCFEPVLPHQPKMLILGSYPSPKSFENGFYYGHPRNRFWPLIAALTNEETPTTVEEKKALLLRQRIALWDVLETCTIVGASDSSIKDPVVNDLNAVLSSYNIPVIFLNGQKAATLYQRCFGNNNIPAYTLPSTSPANAAWNMERLLTKWELIKKWL